MSGIDSPRDVETTAGTGGLGLRRRPSQDTSDIAGVSRRFCLGSRGDIGLTIRAGGGGVRGTGVSILGRLSR